jgi:HEAT repeat protein
LASDPDPDARWWAIRTLAAISDPAVPPLLHAALNDPDLDVRQCAALALRIQPDRDAVLTLVRSLSQGDALLARLSGDALIAVGLPAVPSLIEALDGPPGTARTEAARALALIGDQRAIPSLYAALDDHSALVAHWAEEGLTRMGVGMVFFR